MPPPVTLHHALGGRLYDAVYEEDIDEARVRSLLGQGADTNWRHPEYVSGVAACREITVPAMRCKNMHACKDHIESSTIDMSSHCIYFLLFAFPSRAHRVKGSTPLYRAARNGHEVAVQLLLEHGALVDTPNLSGRTPLMTAAFHGHDGVVRVLLENGADAGLVPHKGAWVRVCSCRRGGRTKEYGGGR